MAAADGWLAGCLRAGAVRAALAFQCARQSARVGGFCRRRWPNPFQIVRADDLRAVPGFISHTRNIAGFSDAGRNVSMSESIVFPFHRHDCFRRVPCLRRRFQKLFGRVRMGENFSVSLRQWQQEFFQIVFDWNNSTSFIRLGSFDRLYFNEPLTALRFMAFLKTPKSTCAVWNLFGIHDPIEKPRKDGRGGEIRTLSGHFHGSIENNGCSIDSMV
jgi:hypothetical protein